MPLHPQLIEAFAHKLPRPPLWLLPPKLFRVLFNWQMRKIESPPEPVAKVQNLRIPGPAGPIPVRVYTPAGVPLLPMLVYFHGGGMVLGTLDTWETPCRALANGSGAIVPTKTLMQRRAGPQKMRRASVAIPGVWRSVATAPEARWPRRYA